MSASPSINFDQDFSVFNPSLDSEWLFLRTAVAGSLAEDPDRLRALCAGVRWGILFDLAERHGVQPLAYQALSGLHQVLPPGEMRALARLYQANLHKSLLLSRELIRLLDHLSDSGIQVLPYKGVALAEGIYGDHALRQAGDIDLLIRARDLPRMRNVVGELGYSPKVSLSAAEERASLRVGCECVFDGPAGRNLLDVQWAIQPRFYAADFDQESLFRRAVPVKVAGHDMKTLSPEDLFLILSVHAAKHVWGRLIWLSDLARLMRTPDLNWNWIAAQAKDLGIVRILRVTFILAKRLLSTDIPSGAEAALPPDFMADSLAREIEKHIASAREYDVESVAYFRLMLRLRESSRDRLRFITRLVFTPGPGEWATVRLPEPLFPLYRIVRLWRLAGKLLGA